MKRVQTQKKLCDSCRPPVTSSDLQDHAQELLALLEREPGGRWLSLRDPHRPRLISEIQWEYRTRNANMTWVIWDWWEEWRLYITKNTGVPINSNSWAGRWDWEGAKDCMGVSIFPINNGEPGSYQEFQKHMIVRKSASLSKLPWLGYTMVYLLFEQLQILWQTELRSFTGRSQYAARRSAGDLKLTMAMSMATELGWTWGLPIPDLPDELRNSPLNCWSHWDFHDDFRLRCRWWRRAIGFIWFYPIPPEDGPPISIGTCFNGFERQKIWPWDECGYTFFQEQKAPFEWKQLQ